MKMEYEKDGKWINMEKMDYNYFVSINVGIGFFKVRMIDICGKVVKDIILKLFESGMFNVYIVLGYV